MRNDDSEAPGITGPAVSTRDWGGIVPLFTPLIVDGARIFFASVYLRANMENPWSKVEFRPPIAILKPKHGQKWRGISIYVEGSG